MITINVSKLLCIYCRKMIYSVYYLYSLSIIYIYNLYTCCCWLAQQSQLSPSNNTVHYWFCSADRRKKGLLYTVRTSVQYGPLCSTDRYAVRTGVLAKSPHQSKQNSDLSYLQNSVLSYVQNSVLSYLQNSVLSYLQNSVLSYLQNGVLNIFKMTFSWVNMSC